MKSNLTDIINNINYITFKKNTQKKSKQCMSCEFIKVCNGGCTFNKNLLNLNKQTDLYCDGLKMVYSTIKSLLIYILIKIKILQSKLINFFYIIDGLSEWHYSCNNYEPFFKIDKKTKGLLLDFKNKMQSYKIYTQDCIAPNPCRLIFKYSIKIGKL